MGRGGGGEGLGDPGGPVKVFQIQEMFLQQEQKYCNTVTKYHNILGKLCIKREFCADVHIVPLRSRNLKETP